MEQARRIEIPLTLTAGRAISRCRDGVTTFFAWPPR